MFRMVELCQRKRSASRGSPVQSSSGLRRAPQQARGAQRITRILDAAAEVIGEVGYEAASTVQIAARAHTAIGSLYQFFPNKEAIVQGLLERYRDELREIFDTLITPDLATLPLPTLLDRIIDPLLDFELGRHGFKALFMSMHMSKDLASATRQLTDEVVGRVAGIFQARLPDLPVALARRHSTIVVQIVKAFLGLADAPIMNRAELIGELKAVLLRYLTPITGA
jgi:AcrR family transcriptional regulator